MSTNGKRSGSYHNISTVSTFFPAIPDQGGEIEQGRKQQEDKEKEQGAKGDDQQALDVMKQKYKARGEEVEIKAVIGDAILLETTLQKQLNSCLRKSPSPERKRDKLRFHFPQESDDEQ